MHIYRQIYEFAASAGAFEGYVYHRAKEEIDPEELSNWVSNLVEAYRDLPSDVVSECQSACNQTLGRAIQSLVAEFGEGHPAIGQLQKVAKGRLPESADDFDKKKWFEE